LLWTFLDHHILRFGVAAAAQPESATHFRGTGWLVGAGVENAIDWLPGVFWKNEYRYADYGNYAETFGNPANIAVAGDIRLRTNTGMLGLTYAFGGAPSK